MKKITFAVALGASIGLLPTLAHAGPVAVGDTITISQVSGTTGSGGPFNLVDSTGTLTSFVTFCLEQDETLGSPMRVGGISSFAQYNGVALTDPLSDYTAWLYKEFMTGPPMSVATASSLQKAIWWLEGEYNTGTAVVNHVNTAYGVGDGDTTAANFVTAALASGFVNSGEVSVINVEKWNGSAWVASQDVLYYDVSTTTTSTPDGGTTLALLGGALMGLGVLRRKVGV